MKKIIFVSAVILLVAAVIACAGCTSTSNSPATPVPTPVPTPAAGAHALNLDPAMKLMDSCDYLGIGTEYSYLYPEFLLQEDVVTINNETKVAAAVLFGDNYINITSKEEWEKLSASMHEELKAYLKEKYSDKVVIDRATVLAGSNSVDYFAEFNPAKSEKIQYFVYNELTPGNENYPVELNDEIKPYVTNNLFGVAEEKIYNYRDFTLQEIVVKAGDKKPVVHIWLNYDTDTHKKMPFDEWKKVAEPMVKKLKAFYETKYGINGLNLEGYSFGCIVVDEFIGDDDFVADLEPAVSSEIQYSIFN